MSGLYRAGVTERTRSDVEAVRRRALQLQEFSTYRTRLDMPRDKQAISEVFLRDARSPDRLKSLHVDVKRTW